MGITIGIDIGGSTTKIVGFAGSKENIISPIFVKANDPVASTYGAFGKYLEENGIKLPDVEKVLVTGVGSSYIGKDILGVCTEHVTEFDSIGKGGLYLTGLDEAIVVSMGTGTALVHAKNDGYINYLGGTGVGGGTLVGLSKKMLNISNIENLVDKATEGDLSNIDLRIADITKKNIIPSLPPKTTASNFGKLSDVASDSDIALGVMNLVFESVGMLAVFAARGCNTKNIVLTGNLSGIPMAKPAFDSLSSMFSLNFIIPENSQFATVIGAALSSF